MSQNRVLYIILAIQTGVIAYLCFSSSQRSAVADIPDQGAQLQQVVEQTKDINAKMDRIISVLESGKLTVKIAEK